MTFDPSIGEEVCAVYFGNPEFASQYGVVDPFNLFARAGIVRTPHGPVAFILWQIAVGSPLEVMVEQYLNPQSIGAIRLVSSAANQSHFKLLVINHQSGEVAAFVDFENVFQFDQLASGMAIAIGHEPQGDFGASMQYAMDSFTIPDLLAICISDPGTRS